MLSLALRLSMTTALTSVSGSGVVPFSPSSLFASGEEGAWYEPSTTTAFTATATGTNGFTDIAPAGYGDLCAILLDKSQGAGYSGGSFTGLGSELVTNGTFDSDVSGWTVTSTYQITWSSGAAYIQRSGAGFTDGPTQAGILTSGKTYYVSIDVVSATNATAIFAGSNFVSFSGTGTKTAIIVADGTDFKFGVGGNLYGTSTIDNISVRELPGNHAVQGTESARPILARVPETGRRNLLPESEVFDAGAGWSTIRATLDDGGYADSQGGTTAAKLVTTVTTDSMFAQVEVSNVSTATAYTWSIDVKADGLNFVQLAPNLALADTDDWANFNLSTGSVGNKGAAATSAITDLGSGWYRCSVTFTADATSGTVLVILMSSDSATRLPSITGTGAEGVIIGRAQFEKSASVTAYQKVVDQYDITEAGVTSLEYLAFDGSDDGMATASIDFTATDKMGVFAGVEKESDAVGILAELSANYGSFDGTFFVSAENLYGTAARGTAVAATSLRADTGTISGADTSVIAAVHDIAGDSSIIRRNGTQAAEATGDKGSGNFSNRGFYIGARGGSSLFFDGKLFSLIVRGAASTAQEISDTEAYLAAKSGVTL